MGIVDDIRGSKLALAAVTLLLALVASLVAVPAGIAASTATTPPESKTGLRATYYTGVTFKKVALTRVDKRIAFNWKGRSPGKGVGKDRFSVRWAGTIEAPRAGTYELTLRADDGVRLWIDGKQHVNRMRKVAKATDSSRRVKLAKGRHTIRIDYVEHTGAASAALYWKGPGIKRQLVPSARLRPTATPEGPAKPWSDPATWGGRVPNPETAVKIPAGMSVLLDQDVSLANLTIEGSLTFARRDLTLEADWIVVHGRLQVGTEAAPFAQRAVIRLRDRVAGENIMNMGDKVLGVMGGTLELHGAKRRVWTRLAANAPRGATSITLADVPDWRPGDRIVVASTDFARSQEEVRTVRAVTGATVTLDTPLEYLHWGEVQGIAGRPVDERAEVALLTRNVTFEGEETSSAGGFGAQIMVMDGGSARVENAELTRVGQAGQLRRYPIHFHMLRDAGATSYLRDTSIHGSNNRCATVHGTNRVAVTGNVCYDHRGHGIFLEDGGEQGNVITGNLVLGTRKPEKDKRLLPSDGSPASYWITNPDNVVRGNVAGGSEGFGFWIALPEHPTGLFATLYPAEAKATFNRRMPLTDFTGNTAHSNDRDGLHFDNGPRPDGSTETSRHEARVDPTNEKSATKVTTIDGYAAYKNRGEGAWLRGSEHRLTRATLADNAIGATFASDESFLQDALVVGETANVGQPERWEVKEGNVGRDGRALPRPWESDFPVRGFQFYDGRVGVERTTFANFQPWTNAKGATRQQSGLGYKLDNDFGIHPRNFATAVSFVNAQPLYLQTPEIGNDGELSSVFLDTDGSVTGEAGRSVAMLNPFLSGAGCQTRVEWNAQVCTGDYASLIVGAPGNPGAVRPVKVTRGDGAVQTLMASTGDGATEASTTVLSNASYTVDFTGGTPAKSRFVIHRGNGHWIRVAIPRAEGFRVTRYGCNVAQAKQWCFGAAGSQAALDGLTRSGYFYDNAGDGDPATGTLHIRLFGGDSDWDELVVEPG